MTSSVITTDIDHVGVAGRNSDALRRAYEKLGFTLTRTEPLVGLDEAGRKIPLGQVSAHFMFDDSYVELTAVTGENPENHLLAWLERYEGLHILALAADDVSAAKEKLLYEGLNPGRLQEAAREIHYGRGGSARFSWFGFSPGVFPEAFVCMVQQRTPEIVFQPEMTDHANGARDLRGVFIVTPDKNAALTRYKPFEVQGVQRFIEVLSLDEAAERFPGVIVPAGGDCLMGMQIGVHSRRKLIDTLDRASVPYRQMASDVHVSPEWAGGSMLVFAE